MLEQRFGEIPEICDFLSKTRSSPKHSFISLKCSSFIPKSYSESLLQICTVVNEIYAFKIFLYGIYIGVILSKLLSSIIKVGLFKIHRRKLCFYFSEFKKRIKRNMRKNYINTIYQEAFEPIPKRGVIQLRDFYTCWLVTTKRSLPGFYHTTQRATNQR